MLPALAAVLLVLLFSAAVLRYLRPTRYVGEQRVSVQIVVLGDIGHSPRMQNHALSIARRGGRVSIIGYRESAPHPDLIASPLVDILALPVPSKAFFQSSNKLFFPLLAVLKVLYQVGYLWAALAYSAPTKWMMLQNPPAVPTMVIAIVACKLRNTRLVIDWHNFGYSILAIKLGYAHPLVRLLKAIELSLCHYTDAHFCVTHAMTRVLRQKVNIKNPILVLHDRPAAHLQPMGESESCEFLASLPETTDFAQSLRNGSTRLLVSSTSWTPDEDFSLLLDALCQYSNASKHKSTLPHLLVIITGKGPQKEAYLQSIAALHAAGHLDAATIRTAWLSLPNYARLLAAASLGVCLHTSSSGVDLPMKVVDMFGVGLPVVGWSAYEAWPELVSEGVDGVGFHSTGELAGHLIRLFDGDGEELRKLRKGAMVQSERRWDAQWGDVAAKIFGLG